MYLRAKTSHGQGGQERKNLSRRTWKFESESARSQAMRGPGTLYTVTLLHAVENSLLTSPQLVANN